MRPKPRWGTLGWIGKPDIRNNRGKHDKRSLAVLALVNLVEQFILFDFEFLRGQDAAVSQVCELPDQV